MKVVFPYLEIIEICKQGNKEGYEQVPPDPNQNTKNCKSHIPESKSKTLINETPQTQRLKKKKKW